MAYPKGVSTTYIIIAVVNFIKFYLEFMIISLDCIDSKHALGLVLSTSFT